MSVTMIRKDDFKTEVLMAKEPVLIDFFATWCGPCRMLAPVLEEIAAERPDIKVVKVDVDEAEELAAAFGVTGIPTLVVMKEGKVENTMVGVRPKNEILAALS